MTKKYKKYLSSKQWKKKVRTLKKLRGNKCQRCPNTYKDCIIDAHHLTYENIFNESFDDLELLCRKCHEKEHGVFKPEKNLPKEKKLFGIEKLMVKKPKKLTKQERKRIRDYKDLQRIKKINTNIENKGVLVRKLQSMGIKEHNDKKLIYLNIDELQDLLDENLHRNL